MKKKEEIVKEDAKAHPSFIERKLKALNEMENQAKARYLVERIMAHK